MAFLEACLYTFSAIYQERAPVYGKYLGALLSSDDGFGRSRAQHRQSEIHELLAFLKFLLKGCESIDVTEGGLLQVGVDLLDGPLGVVCLGGNLLLLGLAVSPHMGKKDPAGAPAEFDNLERKGLAGNCGLAVFLDEVAGESEAFIVTLKLDVGTLVGKGGDCTFHGGTDSVLLLDGIPRVGSELLVTKAELVVGLVEVKDDNVDLIAGSDQL